MLSPRTAQFVDALNREGDNFDYLRWVKGVREEKARELSVESISGESASPKIPALNKSDNRDARLTTGSMFPTRKLLVRGTRLDRKAVSDNSEGRLRRWLGKTSDVWHDFQKCRSRNAVYGYLEAVYGIVMHYKVRRKINRLLRHAFKFAGLPFDANADPFTAVIRCTCEKSLDGKMISKWARGLRYVAHCSVPRKRLKAFMKELGGVNACADRYVRYCGRGNG